MSKLKEALFILKGGKYQESHPSDKLLLNQFLEKEGEADRFIEKLGVLYEDPNFIKFRQHLRCMKAFQLLVASLMILYSLFFIISLATNISPGKASSYEMLYLGFCGILIMFFLLIIYLAYTEAKVFRTCRGPILMKLKNMVGEDFPVCYFTLNIDKNLTIRARPMNQHEAEKGQTLESMDYYDYINHNNPEDDDYYKQQNPYELDPHEKNVMADVVKIREKEIEKEDKKSSKLKFMGAKNKIR